jgi:hypothetical protein
MSIIPEDRSLKRVIHILKKIIGVVLIKKTNTKFSKMIFYYFELIFKDNEEKYQHILVINHIL